MNWFGLFFILVGLFGIAGSVFQWSFFWNSRRVRWMSQLISEPGARIFYILLGTALVVVGVLFFTGTIAT